VPIKTDFRKPQTKLCGTRHWLRLLGALAPLIIGELVHEPEKRWRYIRIASVAMAVISEATWAQKIKKERLREQLSYQQMG